MQKWDKKDGYRIANRTCVSFCNQPKAHFGLPWVRPWDNRGKCHMDEKEDSMHCSMYPSIFNCFPVIQPVSSKVRHFSTFFAHFWLTGYAPGTIAVNVTRLERGFNACKTPRCIYPSVFNRLRAIARYWSEIATFSYPLHLTPPLGCSNWNSGKTFGPQKTRIMGLPGSEDSLTIGWAVSTQYQRVTDRRTDRQTSNIYQ